MLKLPNYIDDEGVFIISSRKADPQSLKLFFRIKGALERAYYEAEQTEPYDSLTKIQKVINLFGLNVCFASDGYWCNKYGEYGKYTLIDNIFGTIRIGDMHYKLQVVFDNDALIKECECYEKV